MQAILHRSQFFPISIQRSLAFLCHYHSNSVTIFENKFTKKSVKNSEYMTNFAFHLVNDINSFVSYIFVHSPKAHFWSHQNIESPLKYNLPRFIFSEYHLRD